VITPRTLRRIDHVDIVNDLATYFRARHSKKQSVGRGRVDAEHLEDGLRAYLRTEGKTRRPPHPPRQPTVSNLALIGDIVGLNDIERAVFQFVVAMHHSRELSELTDTFNNVDLARAATLVATAINVEQRLVDASLRPAGRLVASGLISIHRDSCNLGNKLGLKRGLLDASMESALDRASLLTRFLPEAKPSSLDWNDFGPLAETAKLARDLLGGALRNRRSGVNILLYGETGVGKTALASLLARDLGAKLYAAGLADEDGAPAKSQERLSSLLLGQRLVGDTSAILLFDELEDLFTWQWHGIGPGKAHGVAEMSKQWFNDFLESNPVPTIWISNRVQGIDPAFLRRFTYAVEFRPIGVRQRSRILARHLGTTTSLTEADIHGIAERFTVSPAQIATAVAAAQIVAPDGEGVARGTIERLLAPIERLLAGTDSSRRPVFDGASYRLDAVNSSADLAGIADKLADWRPGRGLGISLCLYGPSGTGKSEYVKYLAHRMGRPIVCRRVSDIMSMWVGQSERAIAEAFREAEDDDAVLLFDEADSFLRDRRTAQRSWEASLVNEFLQQLESFRGVVACTTNLWRELDEASLRRFVFKIEFRYLRPEQAMKLFRSVFEHLLDRPLTRADEAAAAATLDGVGNLTPGDFASIARAEGALGDHRPATSLACLLISESRVKRDTRTPAGFRA
jgi:SpoVK/Ycf46/Vps4 family AAA+-type ATPase